MRHAGCLKGITTHQNSMAFIRNDIATGDMFRHVYGGMTKRELDERAAQLLSAWGYKRVADLSLRNFLDFPLNFLLSMRARQVTFKLLEFKEFLEFSSPISSS